MQTRRQLLGCRRANPAQHPAQRVHRAAEGFGITALNRFAQAAHVPGRLAREQFRYLSQQPRVAADLLEQGRRMSPGRLRIGICARLLRLEAESLDRIEQRRRVNRLDQIAVHSRVQAALAVPGHGMRGQRDDWQASPAAPFGLANRAGGVDPVHAGHLHIHQNQIEATVLQCLQGSRPTVDRRDRVPVSRQHDLGKSAVHGIVFHQQHGQLWRVGAWQGAARDGWRAMMHGRLSRAIRQPEAHREMKGTSLSRRALEPDAAPHHLHQTGRDGESQPRAAIVPRCGGVDLPERREDGRLLLHRNPDSGVTHREIAT